MKMGEWLLHDIDLQGNTLTRERLHYIQLTPQTQWNLQESLERTDTHSTDSPVTYERDLPLYFSNPYAGVWEGPINDFLLFPPKKTEHRSQANRDQIAPLLLKSYWRIEITYRSQVGLLEILALPSPA